MDEEMLIVEILKTTPEGNPIEFMKIDPLRRCNTFCSYLAIQPIQPVEAFIVPVEYCMN